MKKAMIFQGGWQGHSPKPLSELFKSMLEGEGFLVEVFDTLDCLADGEKLKSYDLIVPVWSFGEIQSEYVVNICKAVEDGTGLAGCHGGMCDAFRTETEWQFMTGAQWVSHPGDDRVEYTVNLCGDDYFTAGLSDFKVCSEQYYLHVDPAVKVHATTKFPLAPGPHTPNGEIDMPVVYTKMWGRGRVFYNSLGHNTDVFDVPEVGELMRRGFVRAAR